MELLFEWDESKARGNLRKHGVSFEEAKTVFNDPLLLTYRDNAHSDREERAISIGFSSRHRLLLVVHTEYTLQDDTPAIRIISCRRATAKERSNYES